MFVCLCIHCAVPHWLPYHHTWCHVEQSQILYHLLTCTSHCTAAPDLLLSTCVPFSELLFNLCAVLFQAQEELILDHLANDRVTNCLLA
jgi:hypothetical protein